MKPAQDTVRSPQRPPLSQWHKSHWEIPPFKRPWISEAKIPMHASRDGKLTLWGPMKTCTARSTCSSLVKLEVLSFSRFRHRFNIQLKFLETKPKRKPERDSLCHLHGIWAWVLMAPVKTLLKKLYSNPFTAYKSFNQKKLVACALAPAAVVCSSWLLA